MWKRLNNTRGSRPPAAPQDAELQNEKYGAVGLGIQTQNRKAPPRPPREDMNSQGLPRTAIGSNLPPPPDQRDSKFRPASSIYSQPSPNPIVTKFSNSYADQSEEEVSPPSSPELDRPNYRSQQHEPDVSPVDEMPDVSRLNIGRPPSRPESSSRAASNIPVLRREKRRNNLAPAIQEPVMRKEVGGAPKGRIAHDPRWDPYTGEITTSEKGKPQSTKPGQFTAPGLRSVHKETGIVLGNESNVTSGIKAHTSFGDRVRKLKVNISNTTNAPTAERPEWRGATGRQTIVSPVNDQLDMPPLNIPRKSSKRVASPISATHSGASTPVTIIRSGDGETSPASAMMQDNFDPSMRSARGNSPHMVESPVAISPDPVVAPLSAATRYTRGNTDDRAYEAEPQSRKPVQRAETHPQSQRVEPPPQPYRTPEQQYPQVENNRAFRREDTIAGIERNFQEAFAAVSATTSDPYEQPPSRFSISTYAPTEAHGTPRPSGDYDYNPSPIPTPPTSYAFQEPSTILDRKRPKIGSPQSNISRKAVNPSSPVIINMSSSLAQQRRTSALSTLTTASTQKNLPITPAEAESHDLVTQLQAQLDSLAHRRGNIERSIRQMTELMPKDHVMVTEAVRVKREGEKRKVELLREEEADVRREEHEVGLRLHRAWKRRDKDAVFEPTGLWVRRVTSL